MTIEDRDKREQINVAEAFGRKKGNQILSLEHHGHLSLLRIHRHVGAHTLSTHPTRQLDSKEPIGMSLGERIRPKILLGKSG